MPVRGDWLVVDAVYANRSQPCRSLLAGPDLTLDAWAEAFSKHAQEKYQAPPGFKTYGKSYMEFTNFHKGRCILPAITR
jgi:hypothetical protein